MITYEQDPDVIRWGLQLFDGDPYSNYGYCGSLNQNNTDYYADQYVKGYHYNEECNNPGNNDLVLNSLHEDLSRLSVTEPDKSFQDISFGPSQDWFLQSFGGNYDYGNDNCYKGATHLDHLAISSSSSSPNSESYNGEECLYSPNDMEYALDGKVGKILNQMVPIPHIPKINGEIPSIDEATLDHQRLLDRLQVYELVEFKVPGDGNCQFRALSDQIYRSSEHHKFVRRQVVNQLRSCPDIYEGYVPMAYDNYLKNMSKSGEWGDHVSLQAAADSYGVKIFVLTSFKDTCYIEILPKVQKSERVIFLSFWAEVHYNSIYPQGECPSIQSKRKKKWLVDQHQTLELQDNYS